VTWIRASEKPGGKGNTTVRDHARFSRNTHLAGSILFLVELSQAVQMVGLGP
jgi:hypothetical protein